MLRLLKKPRLEPQAPAAPDAADGAPAIDARAVVGEIARKTSDLGRNSAEVRGLIEDATAMATRQAQAVAALATQVKDITGAQQAIETQTRDSLGAVKNARASVEAVAREVGAIVETLREVADAAGQITQIALQTRLVAFNASVEAKRAGEAGRGFGVVADAVKDLAARVESSSTEIMGTVAHLDQRIGVLAHEIQRQPEGAAQSGFHAALGEVEAGVAHISSAAMQSRGICDGLHQGSQSIETEMHATSRALDSALQRSDIFLKLSESLIETVAQCGIESDDTPYIEAARQTAAEISQLLEQAIAQGAISLPDLFDENYRPIAGTNPAQHLTRFVDLADRLFPAVQERMLEALPKVVYCIAVDRNGYVATHNRKYCHPQRGDLAWDTANSRYRRVFNDRTGLASARNTRPFLLQTYRRDMGGGNFVVMKEAAAPIVVHRRHWGGLRLAFNF